MRAVLIGLFSVSLGCGRIWYAPVDASNSSSTDAGATDASAVIDAAIIDATVHDSGTEDAATLDAGMEDAGTFDAGTEDAGTFDAGTEDAGTFDAGALDGGVIPTEVRDLALGNTFACALLSTGAVRCWGRPLAYGNTNTIGDNETPAAAGDVPFGGTAVQLVSGSDHTCVLLDRGAVRCWGRNFNGQLGYGHMNTIGDNEMPATAGDVSLGGVPVQITAGGAHTCARLETGAVRCWGYGAQGQLGYGNTNNIGDDEMPASAGDVPLGGTAVRIESGGNQTCALLDTGAVRCWGRNSSGELGYGHQRNIGDDETPASAGDVQIGGPVIRLALQGSSACALLDTGALRCWGYALDGQLGYGNITQIGDNEVPASAGDVPLGGSAMEVAVGGAHTCAILDTGAVRCWGSSQFGQLGYANTDTIGDNETPASAGNVLLGGAALRIALGGSFSCALLDTGGVRCWGYGSDYQLGYGSFRNIGDDETPASIGEVPIL
jgi:alpha-tubulin suppressor-like RCC1 family protein